MSNELTFQYFTLKYVHRYLVSKDLGVDILELDVLGFDIEELDIGGLDVERLDAL